MGNQYDDDLLGTTNNSNQYNMDDSAYVSVQDGSHSARQKGSGDKSMVLESEWDNQSRMNESTWQYGSEYGSESNYSKYSYADSNYHYAHSNYNNSSNY